MVFLYKYTTDEDMVRILKNIPNSESMRVLITERQADPNIPVNAPSPNDVHVRAAENYSFNAYDVGSFDVYERQYEMQLNDEEQRRQWERRHQFRR